MVCPCYFNCQDMSFIKPGPRKLLFQEIEDITIKKLTIFDIFRQRQHQ